VIAFLVGRVAGRGNGFALLDVGGVGYRLNMSNTSLAALPAQGDEVFVHTHLHVREDELTLFGFENEAEQHAFERLITVSGVGPKVALATLSTMDPDALATAVATDDIAMVSSVPGIGKKTAQRIILELKDKLGVPDLGQSASAQAPAASEAAAALLSMGISSAEATAALKGYDGDPGDVQAIVKHALRRLGGAL
jgi:holliday junction DNA helicase RuvA